MAIPPPIAVASPPVSPSPTKGEGHLLLAVPKKGRLVERVMRILGGAGLDHIRANRLDVAPCLRQPVTIVFLPAADIAKYVSEGNVDMGITGQDIIEESGSDVDVLMKLGMGRCKLCFQAPIGTVASPADLIGKRIVTSFPNLTRKYFDALKKDHGTTIK